MARPATPRDPYEVLGVPRSADDIQIKKAFRTLARELHPDVNTDDPDAEEKFKEAAEAYEILSDPERRATYDRYGHEGLRSGGYQPNFDQFGSLSDLFEAFFGGAGGGFFGGGVRGPGCGRRHRRRARARARRGRDRRRVHGHLPGDRPLRALPRQRRRARHPDRDVREVRRRRPPPGGHADAVRPDDANRGLRRAAAATAASPSSPAGVPRQRPRRHRALRHRRRPCRHRRRPARAARRPRERRRARRPSGDLYVLVHVREDERFVREGDDLITVLDVPAPLAALGSSFEVPTLDGTATVEVAPGTQPGEILTLRGQGMARLQRHGSGDLRIVVNVLIPRRLSDAQRTHARALQRDDHAREPAQRRVAVLAPAAGAAPPARRPVIRLAVRVSRAAAADALAELLAFSPAGVEEVDVDDAVVEYVLYGAPGELPTLPALRATVGGALVDVATTEIDDDWDDALAHLPPSGRDRRRAAGPRPVARRRPAAAGPIDIVIEPAQAFGTGAHATTRGCLELLVALAREGEAGGPLLDLGTGSGVLAIAAAKLGYAPVVAVDHDPESVDAARANAPRTTSRSTSGRSISSPIRSRPPRRSPPTCCGRCCSRWPSGCEPRRAPDRIGPPARAGRRGRRRVPRAPRAARARPPRGRRLGGTAARALLSQVTVGSRCPRPYAVLKWRSPKASAATSSAR